MESKNHCSSTRKIRDKAADSWAKKIYEDNHGAFTYSYGGSEKNMVFAKRKNRLENWWDDVRN